jgi:hypothetical protein
MKFRFVSVIILGNQSLVIGRNEKLNNPSNPELLIGCGLAQALTTGFFSFKKQVYHVQRNCIPQRT